MLSVIAFTLLGVSLAVGLNGFNDVAYKSMSRGGISHSAVIRYGADGMAKRVSEEEMRALGSDLFGAAYFEADFGAEANDFYHSVLPRAYKNFRLRGRDNRRRGVRAVVCTHCCDLCGCESEYFFESGNDLPCDCRTQSVSNSLTVRDNRRFHCGGMHSARNTARAAYSEKMYVGYIIIRRLYNKFHKFSIRNRLILAAGGTIIYQV